MEVISGIISGILILAVLVTFPLGLRARRRILKEIAELGSQLEERTKSLVERVESLVGEERIAKPTADEAYSAEYRGVDIKDEIREDVLLFKKDIEMRLYRREVLLKEFSIIPVEELFKIAKTDIQCEERWKTKISESSGRRYSPTSSRYLLINKEYAYAK